MSVLAGWRQRLFPKEPIPPEPDPLPCVYCNEPVYPFWFDGSRMWIQMESHSFDVCRTNLLRQIRDESRQWREALSKL